MARCGCAGSCECVLQAGPGISIGGSGDVDNPFVISSAAGNVAATDTPTLDLEAVGAGTLPDPVSISGNVRIATDPGNALVVGGDGLLVSCAAVQACIDTTYVLGRISSAITAGQGLSYTPSPDRLSARRSADAGNALVFGGDGGLFVPSGGVAGLVVSDTNTIDLSGLGTVGSPLSGLVRSDPATPNMLTSSASGMRVNPTLGAGLRGAGTGADPLRARIGTWPWAGSPETAGAQLGAGADGTLYGSPGQQVLNDTFSGGALTVIPPGGTSAAGYSRAFAQDLVNVDTNRTMRGLYLIQVEVRTTLQPGAEVAVAISGQTYLRYNNGGTVARLMYEKFLVPGVISIGVGGTQSLSWTVETSLPDGAATVDQVTCDVRTMAVSV